MRNSIGPSFRLRNVYNCPSQSNILVHDNGRPLICDFGRSKILDMHGFTTRPLGAARYQSPEIHNGDTTTKASDIFAFGVTGFEVSFVVLAMASPSLLSSF